MPVDSLFPIVFSHARIGVSFTATFIASTAMFPKSIEINTSGFSNYQNYLSRR